LPISMPAFLEGMGHPVRVFANAREALKALPLTPPKILVADLAMPDLNGLELAEGRGPWIQA